MNKEFFKKLNDKIIYLYNTSHSFVEDNELKYTIIIFIVCILSFSFLFLMIGINVGYDLNKKLEPDENYFIKLYSIESWEETEDELIIYTENDVYKIEKVPLENK